MMCLPSCDSMGNHLFEYDTYINAKMVKACVEKCPPNTVEAVEGGKKKC